MSKPYLTLNGNLTGDVQVLGEDPVRVRFRLACNTKRFDRQTGTYVEDGDTQYYDVVCWRTLAVNVRDSLRKGDPVLVRGTVRQKAYQRKDGTSGMGTEISADVVAHDLNCGTTHFRRTRRTSTAGDGALAAFEADVAGLAIETEPPADPAYEADSESDGGGDHDASLQVDLRTGELLGA